MIAMSNEHDYWSGWEERAGDPGQTTPYQQPLVKADSVAVGLVCIVFVIVACALVGWWIVVEPAP